MMRTSSRMHHLLPTTGTGNMAGDSVSRTREANALLHRSVMFYAPSHSRAMQRASHLRGAFPGMQSFLGSNRGSCMPIRNTALSVTGGAGRELFVTLLLTASLATFLEKKSRLGAFVGSPLLCFTTFCLYSNFGLVPATHPVYDACWAHLLPMSLAVIIFGHGAMAPRNSVSPSRPSMSNATLARPCKPTFRLGLAFLVGSTGSLVGALTAFWFATSSSLEFLRLPGQIAAQVAGAVVATYVGGSVNLFAVAAAVGLMDSSTGGPSLMGALAASDVFLMSLYFSGLLAAHKTPFLHSIFPASDTLFPTNSLLPKSSPEKNESERRSNCVQESGVIGRSTWRVQLCAAAGVVLISDLVCKVGGAFARRSFIPGTSTLVTTVLAFAFSRVIAHAMPDVQGALTHVAPLLASVLLNAFFAAIGASGRWQRIVGVAPNIFVFCVIGLITHVAVMVAGISIANRSMGAGISIDDMIVASNANIGGPSTAATFAGLIGQETLVLPAAIWGTVGYAVATTLGVGVWRLLR